MKELTDAPAQEFIPASEYAPPAQQLSIQPHPFHAPVVTTVRSGQTLRQMLEECAGSDALAAGIVVRVGGYVVPEALWSRVRPKPGAHIYVGINPLAGNNKYLRTVLLIVVAVVSTWVTGGGAASYWGSAFGAGTFGAAAAGGAIMIAGTLLVNALVPLEQPQGSSGEAGKNWNQLTGTQNGINPWGVIPLIIGESRHYPPHAAMPYSEYLGEDVYQHCLFDLGFLNPGYLVEDIRIGDTPIEDYDGVQYEITTEPTLYRNDNEEEFVNASLENGTYPTPGTVVTRTTAPDAQTISLDFICPQGMLEIHADGKEWAHWVWFGIKYRIAGSSDPFLSPNNIRYSGCVQTENTTTLGQVMVKKATRDPFSWGVSFDVPQGQYEVEVTRYWANKFGGDITYLEACAWQTLRSTRMASPSTTGTVKLAMRIKANDQLNGTLQNLSCLIRNTYKQYDPITETWSDWELGTSPAWACVDLLRSSPAVGANVPDSVLDLQAWYDFAEFASANSFGIRMVLDVGMPLRDLLNQVLRPCLASVDYVNGKYSVVWDRAQTTPSAYLMPTEITNFGVQRIYGRIPHALRVQFRNPGANWENDEIVVVRDGYSYKGKNARGLASVEPAATEFETLELQASMPAQQAWRVARYHFAQALFRPNTYNFDSDIAGLGINRGDLIGLSHEVAGWGVGAGRVVSLAAGGPSGFAATLRLDCEVDTEVGTSYRARLRGETGTTAIVNATPHSPRTDTFYLPSLPSGIGYGDACTIVVTGQESPGVIISRKRVDGTDLGTSFTAVNYDSRVPAYWASPPGTIESEITGVRYSNPATPTIVSVVSSRDNDETNDAGVPRATVRLNIAPQTATTARPVATIYETRYRLMPLVDDPEFTAISWDFASGVEGWTASPSYPTASGGYLVPPTGINSYVVSPSGLGITAADYNVVRARIRKVQSPNWEGRLRWRTTGQPTDWNDVALASQYVDIPTPKFDNGHAVIEFVDIPWTGTVDQIRLDLTPGATSASYFTIDWLAINDGTMSPTGWSVDREPASADIVLSDFIRGRTYEFQVKGIAANGNASPWSSTYTLTVPDTNRTGTLALPANVATKSGVWDVDTTVSYSTTDSSATIDVSAGTLVIEGKTISYGASNVVVSGTPLAEKTFWLYYIDKNLSGGTRTLHATESYTTAIGGSGNVIITSINITFPDVGGSGGGGGGIGGGTYCVRDSMWVEERDLGWIQAGEVVYGMWLRLWNGEWGQVHFAQDAWQLGYRIEMTNGVVIECSDTGPLRVPGGKINARDFAAGMAIYSTVEGVEEETTVSSAQPIGIIRVRSITIANTASGKYYIAGEVQGMSAQHHNRKAADGV